MKRFFRYVCVVLVISLLVPTTALAAEESSTRSSSYFWRSSVYLYKTGNTTFEAWFEVNATGIMDQLGASTIKIQRSADGITWTTMKTYTSSAYPDLLCENTGSHVGCVSYAGTAGYYYRAVVTLYAKNGSGIGEVTEYTSSMLL